MMKGTQRKTIFGHHIRGIHYRGKRAKRDSPRPSLFLDWNHPSRRNLVSDHPDCFDAILLQRFPNLPFTRRNAYTIDSVASQLSPFRNKILEGLHGVLTGFSASIR